MATLSQAWTVALRLHRAGDLAGAESIYRQILQAQPDFAEGYSNLGAVLKAAGQLDDAAACYQQALTLKPELAEALSNLGALLKDQGKLDESIACLQRAVSLKPQLADAHNNLGTALQAQGRLVEAAECYRRAAELKPDWAEAHFNLGTIAKAQQRLEAAAAHYRQAAALRPDFAEAFSNLGNACRELGNLAEAVVCYRRAIELRPQLAEAWNNLGTALKEQGQFDEAIAGFSRALNLRPQFAEASNNLGTVLRDLGALDDAVAAHRQALAWKPDFAEAYNNLGTALKDQGLLAEAIASYRRAIELKPDLQSAHSNLLYTLAFCPEYDAAAILAEHHRWNDHHVAPLRISWPQHVNDRAPNRRLRIGYVSPDFRDHCQAYFTLPLLSAHDRQQFEIFCYSDVVRPDAMTERLREQSDGWRTIVGRSHERVAQIIRDDRIDILVDLTMHMARGRPLVFARKPAPVQVCWLAYPGTTGNSAIDYRLTDPQLDPLGASDAHYSEKSVRLPQTFWCYDPLTSEPLVSELPASARRTITFGSLNNYCKVNAAVLQLWARVLRAVKDSRLALLAPQGSCRQRALDVLTQEGIASDRIELVAPRPRPAYLALYHQIDIGLDSLPYNGHTTSLDAYWMGVPVVTLAGATVVGRAGVSQLMNLGLPDLIAHTPEQFVAVAAGLAGDLSRLGQLRRSLRERMRASPLMDWIRFARHVEAAYRSMWQRWCAGRETLA